MGKIGLIGLGTMGANLARNVASKGHSIVTYNRTTATMEEFINEHGSDLLTGEAELEDFVKALEVPRKIIILVKAGGAVDAVIEGLKPFLDKGDIIIDGGNSLFTDTQRRFTTLAEEGLQFVGCGVSGGEEGALHGPSLMPGGSESAWNEIKEIFEDIAARDFNDGPCVTYVGDNGAGHYVKMVHNGIEYGVMQIMAEGYQLLSEMYGLSADDIGEIFEKYNEGKLKSFLFEIAIPVLQKKEGDTNLIDLILDKAGQKGTGRWTAIDALERGVVLSTIAEAVNARGVSSFKERREALSKIHPDHEAKGTESKDDFIKQLEDAMYTSMLCSYAQGYELIQTAAKEEEWNIDLAEVSRIWEGGCIIRAEVLNELHKFFEKSPDSHLLEMEDFGDLTSLRSVCSVASDQGLPIPCLAASLNYFENSTRARTSANMIQGLRDFFGAHTYERTDKEGSFHTEWGRSRKGKD